MRKKYRFTILFIFSLLTIHDGALSSQLEELLSAYEEVSELSKKTRTESLGHYAIITRRDLDIMQAYTLSDVLKSIKLHTFLPNRFGVYQPISAGSIVGVNTSYRLYVDDHEVSSIHTDNPFLMFDNYPLDGINHIEIYHGSGAVRLGNEPSLIIIKLYTKEPARENSSTLRSSFSNRKSFSLGFNDARVIKDGISYNLMVNHSKLDFPSYYVNNQSVSRDILGSYIFLKLNYYDTTVDLSYINVKRDAFGGIAPDFTPNLSKTTSEDLYINITQRMLQDKSLKLNLSLDLNRRTGEFANELQDGGIFIAPFYPNPPNPLHIPTYYYESRNLNKYTFYLSKEFKTDRNNLLLGGSLKIKENNIDRVKYTTLSGSTTTDRILPLTKITLYTLFLENQFNITDSNLIIASLKYDHYHRDRGYREISDYIARFGFISYISNSLYVKGFLNRTYVPPSFYEIEMSKGGRDLRPEKINGASGEISYIEGKHNFSLFYGYVKAKDMISFVPYGENIPKALEGHYISLDYQYKFNPNNRISLNLYKSLNNFDDFTSTDGGYLKLFNSFNHFDLYNELVYRKGYSILGREVKDSLNYTFGLSYRINMGVFLKVKGENIFNSSPKAIFPTFQGDLIQLPSFERRFIVTLEKVF